MPKETEKEAEFRRGPFGHGPRAFAKVVERVTARLQSRLARERAPSAAAALTCAVDKAWRETYAGPLPTEKEVLQQRSKILGSRAKRPTKGAFEMVQETAAGPSLMRKRRFVLKALTKNAKKRKRTRLGGNDGVSAEDGDGAAGRNTEDERMPQDKVGRAAEGGQTVNSAGPGAPRRIDEEPGCCNIACAEGNDKCADGCIGHGSRTGSVEVSSASTVCAHGDDGASTAEKGEGAGTEERRESGLDPGRGGVEKQESERTGFEEKKGPASSGADAGHDSEVEEEAKPPDVVVTANFVGDLKKGSSSKRKNWKVVLEGGALEGYGGVLVFDKCACSFVSV